MQSSPSPDTSLTKLSLELFVQFFFSSPKYTEGWLKCKQKREATMTSTLETMICEERISDFDFFFSGAKEKKKGLWCGEGR